MTTVQDGAIHLIIDRWFTVCPLPTGPAGPARLRRMHFMSTYLWLARGERAHNTPLRSTGVCTCCI